MSKPLLRARAFFLITLVWAVIALGMRFLPALDSILGLKQPAWVRMPAVVIMALGGALMMGCGLMLSTIGIGTLAGQDRLLPRDFIASGPFLFVRNPMSLGAVVLMAGIAMGYRSTVALLVTAVFFLVCHLNIVLVEEPGLERRFGESYLDYKLHVPRWLPRITPWTKDA